jgi:CheY-like chemotaxis protein
VQELKVLYVEDCEEMGRFVKTLLGKNAYSVKTVPTGKEAILAAQSARYDLRAVSRVILSSTGGMHACTQ